MSAATSARRMRERPITERRRALAIVAVLLAAGAILLAATRPSQPRAVPQRATTSLDSARPAVPAGPDAASAAPVAPGAARAARRFLAGYLAYLYGHAPAAAVTAAVPALMRTLRTRPPLVSPAMRARRPRVLALRPTSASAGRVGVSALVNDGELADYSVGLLLERGHRRLLIDAVEGAP